MEVGMKALVCILTLFALSVSAVIEKTREDLEHRRHVFTRNRTESRHRIRSKYPTVSRFGNSSTASILAPNGGHIKDPVRNNNRSFWSNWPHRYGGSIHIGPGLNIQLSSDFDWGIGIGGDEHWWKGPNVCLRNETHEDVKEVSNGEKRWRVMHHRLMVTHTCDDTGTAYKCTTVRGLNGKVITSVKIYECCPGYERAEDEPGCTEAFEPTDLMSTLGRLNATEMMQALQMSGLAQLLNRENYTIFAPIDEAFKNYKMEETNSNIVKITPELMNAAKDMDDTIVAHVVKGFVRTSDVEDEQLLSTELESANIRINKYNVHTKKLMTANCVPMVVKDVPATNGMVHMVQGLLPPVTQSLEHLISRNPELSQLSRVIKGLQLGEQGQYTLFAPTNLAFDKMKPSLKEKIRKGHRCGIEVLKQHLLPNVVCSAVTQTRAVTKNVLDRYVTLRRESGKLLVNDAQVIQPDIMGTNGVLHVIDQVLIPDDAGDILDAAERTGTSSFLQLIESAGLTEKLHNMNNFTMFLPNNDAIKALPSEVLDSLSKNMDQLEQMIDYHIVPQRIKYRGLINDMELPTLDGKNDILVKSYYSFPFSRYSIKTVQCAPIVQSDVNSCGDVVHVVSKVLLPPTGDVLYVLENNPDFTKLMVLVKLHKLEDLFKVKDSFTFFAPTNKAFESLSAEAQSKLQNDPEKLTKLLKSHMIADVLCCGGVFKNSYPFSSREVNLEGWIVAVERNNKAIYYGNVPVASCDKMGTNGIVHSIDKFVSTALDRYDVIHAENPFRDGIFSRWNFDDIFDYLDQE